METNLVECHYCNHWDDNRRRHNTCPHCGNTQKVTDPRSIKCNLCGEHSRPIGTYNEQYKHGLEDVAVVGGYDSYHLSDMTRYRFTLCEKCLRNIFNQCKIPPTVSNIGFSSIEEEYDYAKDRNWHEFMVWKDAGGHHQAYLDKKCNAIKDCPNRAIYTFLVSGDFTEDCSCEEHKNVWMYGNTTRVKFISSILRPFL